MAEKGSKDREHLRASVALTVRYREPQQFEELEGTCRNISRWGMFVCTTHLAPVGSLLKVDCKLAEGGAHIRGLARVLWLRREAADEDRPAGMGLRFVKLEPGSERLIAAVLPARDRTPGRRARSDPPEGQESLRPRPRLVAMNPKRPEVGGERVTSNAHAPSPESAREHPQATQSATPPEPATGAVPRNASSEPPPPRASQPAASQSPEHFGEAGHEPTGTYPIDPTSGSARASLAPDPAARFAEAERLSDPEWRAIRLAELVEQEASRTAAERAEARSKSIQEENEAGVQEARGPSTRPLARPLRRVAIGVVLLAFLAGGTYAALVLREARSVPARAEQTRPRTVVAPLKPDRVLPKVPAAAEPSSPEPTRAGPSDAEHAGTEPAADTNAPAAPALTPAPEPDPPAAKPPTQPDS